MSLKERTHSKDSGTLKQTPSKPAVKDNAVAQPQTGPEQIRQNYGAVAQQNILQLQRTFGNRAVTELLTRATKQPTQHQVEANQASRMNVASTGGLVNRPVIQRTIKIEDDKGAEVQQLKTPADVKGYLEKNGIHFYYQYVKAAEITDEIYEKKVTTYREPDAPQQLVTLLQQYQPGTGDINAPGEGAQDFIQKKMLEIYELVRRHSVASLNLDKDSNEEYVDKTPQWYEMLGINGLCGGWVAIHQRHPEWIEDLWNAVESLHPPHGKSTAETLRLLDDHLGASLS
jgi:hypothetical protein